MSKVWTKFTIKELFWYTVIGLVVTFVFSNIVHELGHGIYILLFGGKIIDIVIFPMSYLTDGIFHSYITYSGSFTDDQLLIITMGGSITTLITGLLFLYVVLRYKAQPLFEYWSWLFSFITILDMVMYLVSDLILTPLLQTDSTYEMTGDWSRIYVMCPEMVYVFIPLNILLFVLCTYVLVDTKNHRYFNFLRER
jgi:Zn-dependent protease